MVTIKKVLSQIEDYRREVGYRPHGIAVTPDQMEAILSDPEADTHVSHDDMGRVTIAGVRLDVWGRPKAVAKKYNMASGAGA